MCGTLDCGSMEDIVEGRSLEGTLYCKEPDQRQWLLDLLAKKDFEACPKKGSGRHAKEHFTAMKKAITPADAATYRMSLSQGPVRRISVMRNVKKLNTY